MDDDERAHIERDYFAELLNRVSVIAVEGLRSHGREVTALDAIVDLVPAEQIGRPELWNIVITTWDNRTKADALRNFAVLHVGLHGTATYDQIMEHATNVERGHR